MGFGLDAEPVVGRDGGRRGRRLAVDGHGWFSRQRADGGDRHGRASGVGGLHDGFRTFGSLGGVAYAAGVAVAPSVSGRSDHQIDSMDAVAVDGRDAEFIWYRAWNGSDGACVGLWRRGAYRIRFANGRQAFIKLDGPVRPRTSGDRSVRHGVVSCVVAMTVG